MVAADHKCDFLMASLLSCSLRPSWELNIGSNMQRKKTVPGKTKPEEVRYNSRAVAMLIYAADMKTDFKLTAG